MDHANRRRSPSHGLIDISLSISSELPIWPGSPKVRLERRLDIERGDHCNDTILHMSSHTGTHVDAPLHFLAGGADVSQLPLDVFLGHAFVARFSDDVDLVTANDLDGLSLPEDTERLLLKTRNSDGWAVRRSDFDPDFVALSSDAASWIVARGIRLVGVDYLSVERFGDGHDVHRILLRGGVVILEGLNLAGVQSGEYELICLPVRLTGAEGVPARAALRPL